MVNEGKKQLLFLCLLSIGISVVFLVLFFQKDAEAESWAAMSMEVPKGGDIGYTCTRIDLDTGSDGALAVDLSQINGDYTITEPGSYLLYGDYEGQICIDAEEQIVHLILKDVAIDSLSGSAIDVKSAGKIVITLAEDSSNIIQDNARYRGREDGDAAIYSACDLTVNGSGTLEVYGFYDHAIHSKDIVKILGGEIFVQAKGNGIQGNDGLLISPDSLSVESEGNGLYSKKTGNDKKGTVQISGGEISIIAGEYAVSSSNDLYVRDCSIWCNAVLGPLYAAGEEYLMEGCLENE